MHYFGTFSLGCHIHLWLGDLRPKGLRKGWRASWFPITKAKTLPKGKVYKDGTKATHITKQNSKQNKLLKTSRQALEAQEEARKHMQTKILPA